MLRIALFDDHASFREALALILDAQPNVRVTGDSRPQFAGSPDFLVNRNGRSLSVGKGK
jgi:hypothetical protein